MFTIAVKRHFSACHFLTGGDWGAENERHSHNYAMEVRLEGPGLNEHGYLMDIVEIENRLDEIVAHLSNSLLNELSEFTGLNPSIERLAEWCCRRVLEGVTHPPISAVEVKVFETDSAWASYRQEIS
jgi:6-pyruvoyltetrahydropterin/6-carboxytetrahydropterin synthase